MKSPSEKVVLTASDLPEEGWRQKELSGPAMNFFISEDSCRSTMEQYNETGTQAAIMVYLYHFNSTEEARAQYDSSLSHHSTIERATIEQIPMDKGMGFIVSNISSVLGVDTELQVYAVRGSYLAYMLIGWNDPYGWTTDNVTQVAKIQAEKMV